MMILLSMHRTLSPFSPPNVMVFVPPKLSHQCRASAYYSGVGLSEQPEISETHEATTKSKEYFLIFMQKYLP